MEGLENLFTVAEIDAFIDEACRHSALGYRQYVESHEWTEEELEKYPKAKLIIAALARREMIASEVRNGMRAPTGEVHVRV